MTSLILVDVTAATALVSTDFFVLAPAFDVDTLAVLACKNQGNIPAAS